APGERHGGTECGGRRVVDEREGDRAGQRDVARGAGHGIRGDGRGRVTCVVGRAGAQREGRGREGEVGGNDGLIDDVGEREGDARADGGRAARRRAVGRRGRVGVDG